MKLTCWGAAGTVTGSQHLLEVGDSRLLLDCGLYQGRRADSYAINQNLPFDARRIDAVVLSHAHIDHSGNIPNLVRSGFDGHVCCTHATRDLCAAMLRDSAMIQQEDARFLNKRRSREDGAPLIEPIYTLEDAEDALRAFVSYDYGRPIALAPNARAWLDDAGHMLGSAWALVEAQDNGRTVRVCFSGDLGRFGLPILRDPRPMPEADYLIIESTYGDRTHPPISDALPELGRAVDDAVRRGGKVIIPAFAVGRTQEIVYALHQLMLNGQLADAPIFVDSPLAVNVTEIFRQHPECYDRETRRMLTEAANGDVFGFRRLSYIRDVASSKALNHLRGPAVIISASGMCENGRILHHLRNSVEDPKNLILFVSFQAENTLGRRILDGERRVRILGDDFRVRAEVRRIEAFSGHADRNDLLRWVKPRADRLRGVFVVHGEPRAAQALAEGIRALGAQNVHVPARGDSFEL